MNIRSRSFTSLVLAGSILAGGGLVGAAGAVARDNGSTRTAQGPHGANHSPAAVMTAVTGLLSINDATLKAARQAGTTLTALAQSKGVGRNTLVRTIASALKAAKPATSPARTAAQLRTIAGRIADQVPRAKGPRAGRNKAVRSAVEGAIASTLGITATQLRAARVAGTSPATLARQKGIARDTLVAAVVAALRANTPSNAPAVTDAQRTDRARNIVDSARPTRGSRRQRAHRG